MEYSQLQSILASNIHARNIAERDYKEAQAEAKRWEKRYQLALKAGREDLIQEAKFRQNLYAKKQYNLKLMLDEQTARVASLQGNLSHLKLNLPCHTKPFDEISQQYEASSENLITKLYKVEGKLEDINNELLMHQENIKKLLQQNLNVLTEVRMMIIEFSSHANVYLNKVEPKNHLLDLDSASFIDRKEDLHYQGDLHNTNYVEFEAELEDLRSQLDKL